MKFNKIFQITLDIENPLQVMENSEQNIMEILRNLYQGKCIQSVFVSNILRIINKSFCEIDHHTQRVLCQINVEFEAEVITYDSGEIIPCCKITSIKPGEIRCKHNNISILAETTDKVALLLKDDLYVNIKVLASKVNNGSNRISIIGEITFDLISPIFTLTTSLDSNNISKLESILDIVDETDFQFSNLYKNIPNSVSSFPISELIAKHKANKTYTIYKNIIYEVPDLINNSTHLNAYDSIYALIKAYTNYKEVMSKMNDIFSDKSILDKHKILWKLYNQ